MNLKRWLCSALLAALLVTPVFAGNNNGADPKSSPSANTANSSNSAEPAASPASPSPASPSPSPTLSASPTHALANANMEALLGALVTKGVLAPSEANAIRSAGPDAEFQLLVEALSRKGILSAADLSAAANPTAQPSAVVAAPVAVVESVSTSRADVSGSQSGPPVATTQQTPQREKPLSITVVAAVSPVRVLPVDPPVKDGLNAAFKMGPVKMTPYGFIKATAAHDSSSPNGDDFPFVGLFLTTTSTLSTGPTADPEFHLKARSTRIGANFEWPDSSPRLTFTGRVEGDYEGNFSEVDNRDVSSIRSNAFQLRLAYARMDFAANAKTDIFFEGGQDWALFGSAALPNILETTFLGAFYGDIYTRSPQMMLGLVQKVGDSSRNFKIAPTVAIMMPSSGQILKLGSLGLAAQLGEGEREGADSDRPELEAKLAFQWQLDKAPAVAPAQVFWSGFHARRTSITTNADYFAPTAAGAQASCAANPALCLQYQAAFPNGFETSSTLYGNQIAVQLPTRWFTFVASGYRGGDMRFFFGGQVNSYFTDTGGLSGPITFATIDGGPLAAAGPAQLTCNEPLVTAAGVTTCPGAVVIAPQRPVRSFGGFVNLGLPLSRWFNANPKGHNAGWQLFLHAGKDQVVHRDLINPNADGVLPLLMGKVFAATLYYKVNPWATFAIEQSVYGTRLEPGVNYSIAGEPSNLWQDHRTEFGPVFTF